MTVTIPAEAAPAKVGNTTLGEALPKEITRCQELVTRYTDLGPVGGFGAAMIRRAIAAAIKATMEGDVVDMIRAYNELRGCQ
jgi:hypothetical protein